MAKTIEQGFNELQRNLNITNLQESVLTQRQNIIRVILEKEFVVLDTFLMGSYKRHTLISPLSKSDIDIFVVLDPRYFDSKGQAVILERFRQVLRMIYASTAIRPDGQAVTVTFDDFSVDIVPGFNQPHEGYLIPDPSFQKWIPTNPKKHIKIWADENKVHNEKLVPLLKMLKGWNTKHNRTLRSFHLETMALQLFRGIEISDYSLAVGYVFDKLRTQIKTATFDEAGYGGNVGEYLDSPKLSIATSSLEIAYQRAIEAKTMEARGLIFEAFQKWRLIFNGYFPVYE